MPFQEAWREAYPDLQTQQQVGLMMTPEGAFQTDASKHWRFVSADGAWAVVLATDFLTLEATAPLYTDYSEFRRRFGEVWTAAEGLLSPSRCVQQGLRYINHIEREFRAAEWNRLINPILLGPIGSDVFGEELEQAICDIRLTRSDGQLVMKHGVVRAGPERRRGYLLDFDYFVQEPADEMDAAALLRRFDQFHAVIYQLFRWSITEEALNEFQDR